MANQKKLEHIMVDLETLSNGPRSAILSIGAVKFDPNTGVIGDKFYVVCDIKSNQNGREIDGATLKWWMSQSEGARKVFAEKGIPLRDALIKFAQFFDHKNYKVWGNGADFDNAILNDAYKRSGMERPWNYSGSRCHRTMRALAPEVKVEFNGTAHNALDDAYSQALHLIAIVKALNIRIS